MLCISKNLKIKGQNISTHVLFKKNFESTHYKLGFTEFEGITPQLYLKLMAAPSCKFSEFSGYSAGLVSGKAMALSIVGT